MRALLIGQTERAEMQPIVQWLNALYQSHFAAVGEKRAESCMGGAGTDGTLVRHRRLSLSLSLEREAREQQQKASCSHSSPLTGALDFLTVDSIRDAVAAIKSGWYPDLIVVLESHPDEYFKGDIDALFAAAPIARTVCCAGAWSESAGRTRKQWPLALRVPAISAIACLEREWELLNNWPASDVLPPTGSREGWFAAHHPAIPAMNHHFGTRVQLISPDAAYRQMLADVFATVRMTMVEDEQSSADIVICDIDPWHGRRIEAVRGFCAAGPVIAVSGWVTPDEEAELLNAGIAAVVPKLGDLHRLLAEIVSEKPEAPAREQ